MRLILSKICFGVYMGHSIDAACGALASAELAVFSPHWMHLQRLADALHLGCLMTTGSTHGRQIGFSLGLIRFICQSDLLFAVPLLTGRLTEMFSLESQQKCGPNGWIIRNNSNLDLIWEQCLPPHDDNNSHIVNSLQVIHRVHLSPGRSQIWRPTLFSPSPKGNSFHIQPCQITVRVGFPDHNGTKWSIPVPLRWPPFRDLATSFKTVSPKTDRIFDASLCRVATEVTWPSLLDPRIPVTRSSPRVPTLTLLILAPPASGFPGEILLQSGIVLHNHLPFDVDYRLGWGANDHLVSEGTILGQSSVPVSLFTGAVGASTGPVSTSSLLKGSICFSRLQGGWTPFSVAVPARTITNSFARSGLLSERKLIRVSFYHESPVKEESIRLFPVLLTTKFCRVANLSQSFLSITFSSTMTFVSRLQLPVYLKLFTSDDENREALFLSKSADLLSSSESDLGKDGDLIPNTLVAVEILRIDPGESVPIMVADCEKIQFKVFDLNDSPVFEAPFSMSLLDAIDRLAAFDSKSVVSPLPDSTMSSLFATDFSLGLIANGASTTTVDSISLVVRPWLKFVNESNLDLTVLTSSGPQGDMSKAITHVLVNGASFVPDSGQRLFRIGLTCHNETSWSSTFLVHKSAFKDSAYSPASFDSPATSPVRLILTAGASLDMIASKSGPVPGRVFGGDALVTPLSPLSPCACLVVPLRRTACCLSVYLRSERDNETVVIISPHIQFDNRNDLGLLCKPIIVPLLRTSDNSSLQPADMALCEDLDSEVLTLPAGSDVPSVFANVSHPDLLATPASGSVELKYALVFRAQHGVFWSRSLLISEVFPNAANWTLVHERERDELASTGDVDCQKVVPSSKPALVRSYHISLPTYDADGNLDEASVLLSVMRFQSSGCLVFCLDRLSTAILQCLSCSIINFTDFDLCASLESEHSLPISAALPVVQSNGGKLILLPQNALDSFAYGFAKTGLFGRCAFLADQNCSLKLSLDSTPLSASVHIHLRELVASNGDSVLFSLSESINLFARLNEYPACPFAISVRLTSVRQYRQPDTRSEDTQLWGIMTLSIGSFSVPVFASTPLWRHPPNTTIQQRDLLHLSARCLEGFCVFHGDLFDFHFSSSIIQVDNCAHSWTDIFDFPVILRSILTPSTALDTANSVFSFSGRLAPSSAHLLEFRLPQLEAFIEDTAVYSLLLWVQDVVQTLQCFNLKNLTSSHPLTVFCLAELTIFPISLRAALRATMGMHLSCKSTRFRLAAFQFNRSLGNAGGVSTRIVTLPKCLLGLMANHYMSQVLLHAGWLLGGLELIGNPAGLVSELAAGVWDLVHLADSVSTPDTLDTLDMTQHRRVGLLRGLASGLSSLVKHTTGGVCDSVTGLAATFARNLHDLSLDSEHILRAAERRQHGTPGSLIQGLRFGLGEFGVSLLGGLAGLAHHPLQACMDGVSNNCSTGVSSPQLTAAASQRSLSQVAVGVLGGLGKGLVGVIAKPLAGAADLVALTGAGLMHDMGYGWDVTPVPSHFPGCGLEASSAVLVDCVQLCRWSSVLVDTCQSAALNRFAWNDAVLGASEGGRRDILWVTLDVSGTLLFARFSTSGKLTFHASPMFQVTGEPLSNFLPPNFKSLVLVPLFQLGQFLDSSIENTAVFLSPEKVNLIRAAFHNFLQPECHFDVDSCPDENLSMMTSDESNAGHNLERVKAYLSSLPH